MNRRKSVVVVAFVGLCFVANVVLGGFTEEIGGYKARGDNTKEATSYYGLDEPFKQEYLEAAYMAECGYPDERCDMYKNTDYREVSESKLVEIVNKVNEANRGQEVKLHIQHQQIYETVTEKGLVRKEVTKRKAVEGVTMLTIAGKGKDRLSARIFVKKDEKGNDVVGVVFCGTDLEDGHSFGDVIDDVKQIVHVAPTPLAYKEAAELLKAVKEIYPDSDINVYGHSEGGGEAQYAVLHSGILDDVDKSEKGKRTVRCYGVNSAGLNGLESVNDLKDELDTVEKKNKVKDYVEKNFVLIQNEGEWCSTKAYQFGKYILVDTLEGKQLLDKDGNPSTVKNVYGKDVQISELNKQHGIEETRLKMEYNYSPVKEEQKSNQTSSTDESPFNSNPEPEPDTPTPTVTPDPSNTTQMRRSFPTRVRRGGGDTSAIIWQKR